MGGNACGRQLDGHLAGEPDIEFDGLGEPAEVVDAQHGVLLVPPEVGEDRGFSAWSTSKLPSPNTGCSLRT